MTAPVHCAPFACTLSAVACARRWAGAQSSRKAHLHCTSCRRCPDGKARARLHQIKPKRSTENDWAYAQPGSRR